MGFHAARAVEPRRAVAAGIDHRSLAGTGFDDALTTAAVQWFDRPDGRYLMQVDDAVTVTPASSHELTVAVGRQLGVVTRHR